MLKYAKVICSNFTLYFKLFSLKYGFLKFIFFSIVTAIVFIVADTTNALSKFISKYSNSLAHIWLYFILLLSIYIMVRFRIFKMIVHPLINKFDYLLLVVLGALLIVYIAFLIGYPNQTPRTNLLYLLTMSSIIFMVIRIYYSRKKLSQDQSVVVDLKDIIDGKVNFNRPFAIRESDVDYDLLSRNFIIDDLVNWIKNYQSNERFVIGVEGKWGSGKTTLIRNVLKQINDDNVIVIDEFEPWVSDNKNALLQNLLTKILTNLHLDIPNKEISNVINLIIELVLGKASVPIFSMLGEDGRGESAEQILSEINNVLEQRNTRIIFVIDNLDRLLADNILLILNIVQNVLKLSNLVVILSYDREELENNFNQLRIGSGYLDKLVQKKVVIPLIDYTTLLDIYDSTIQAIADGMNIDYDHSKVSEFLSIIAQNNVDLREFKRFLNSVLLPIFNRRINKSLLDMLVIEFIRFSNLELYNAVYLNARYFISTDRELIEANGSFGAYIANPDEYDKKFNIFFEQFLKQDLYGGKLLALIFPTVADFLTGNKRDYRNVVYGDAQYSDVQKNKRICSGKFFSLYFTLDNNYEANVVDATSAFFEELNLDGASASSQLVEISKCSTNFQNDFFTNLALYIKDIKKEKLPILVSGILKNYFIFGYDLRFMMLDTQARIAIVIAQIFELQDINLMKNVITTYVSNPKYLTMIANISYWLEHNHSTVDNSGKVHYLKTRKKQLIRRILDDEFNLYSKELYQRGNAFQLLYVLREDKKEDEFKAYIDRQLNEGTVYRVLNDIVSAGTGTGGYSYQIMDSSFKYVSKDKLTMLLNQAEPKNDRQRFIKKVFDNHLLGKTDKYGDICVHRDKAIDLKKID